MKPEDKVKETRKREYVISPSLVLEEHAMIFLLIYFASGLNYIGIYARRGLDGQGDKQKVNSIRGLES